MTYFLIRTMTDSAQYLGVYACQVAAGAQFPTVNCLSEESDISSYFVDISVMFASLIQLNIINFCVLMVNRN